MCYSLKHAITSIIKLNKKHVIIINFIIAIFLLKFKLKMYVSFGVSRV